MFLSDAFWSFISFEYFPAIAPITNKEINIINCIFTLTHKKRISKQNVNVKCFLEHLWRYSGSATTRIIRHSHAWTSSFAVHHGYWSFTFLRHSRFETRMSTFKDFKSHTALLCSLTSNKGLWANEIKPRTGNERREAHLQAAAVWWNLLIETAHKLDFKSPHRHPKSAIFIF